MLANSLGTQKHQDKCGCPWSLFCPLCPRNREKEPRNSRGQQLKAGMPLEKLGK